MPRNWQARVDSLSNVGKLVHLAARFDSVDEARIQGELLRMRRRVYEDELKIQARRAGCGDRMARLENNASLTRLADDSARDAASIVNTYNYDLAVAIEAIRTETPTANRHVYASRLATWESRRNQWKARDIALMTEGTARRQAQQDFARLNGMEGTARLEPRTAKEPICEGWIRRGNVPLRVALNNPPPYHNGCPHFWQVNYERLPAGECFDIWLGQ
jgi:hypothetical protein